MSYVDAFLDRDSDIVLVVERKDGKRDFFEYPQSIHSYYKDERGKYKSVYGDPQHVLYVKTQKTFQRSCN